MNVLSLFDGISCGQVALNRIDLKYKKYYASEIDKHAIAVTQQNFPHTTQLGDVQNVSVTNLEKIDLLLGGSPCQGFSFIGKGLNFDDPRSMLFFEYVRLLKETKPKHFLLENVLMNQKSKDIISKYLGVQPLLINSSLFSAQNRKRLYWTNIPVNEKIIDKNISLDEIIEHDTKEYKVPKNWQKRVPVNLPQYVDPYNKKEIKNKSTTLRTNVNNGNMWVKVPEGYRNLTVSECEKLQTLPENYTKCLSPSLAKKTIGNGWTVDVICYILNHIKSNL